MRRVFRTVAQVSSYSWDRVGPKQLNIQFIKFHDFMVSSGLTWRILSHNWWNILSKNYCEPPKRFSNIRLPVNILIATYTLRCHSMWLIKLWASLGDKTNECTIPVKKPWTRIVRFESYGNIITRRTNVDNIALNWVYEIIHGASGRPDDMKIVLDQQKKSGSRNL